SYGYWTDGSRTNHWHHLKDVAGTDARLAAGWALRHLFVGSSALRRRHRETPVHRTEHAFAPAQYCRRESALAEYHQARSPPGVRFDHRAGPGKGQRTALRVGC